MKRSTKDKARGRYHELKDRRLQAEGLGEKFAGKVQKAIGKTEKAVEKR